MSFSSLPRLLALALIVGVVGCDSSSYADDEDLAPGDDAAFSAALFGGTLAELNTEPLQDQFLVADLTGEAEVGEGDPDGSGTARVLFFPNRNLACFQLRLRNIEPPTRAHIHRGEAGVNGPIAISFFDTVVDDPVPAPPNLIGCVTAERSVIAEILDDPAAFYVNIHTADFPPGAIRGQLAASRFNVNESAIREGLLTSQLSGEAEVGEGDPDGSGIARVVLLAGPQLACFQLDVRNIEPPTRAHIHRGEAGVNGPIAISFFDTVVDDP
ncbi:MAG: CHRD domain-containing protein, partial [Bacteroidota bacterium]